MLSHPTPFRRKCWLLLHVLSVKIKMSGKYGSLLAKDGKVYSVVTDSKSLIAT
jgi:hypothetical protein